MESNDDLNQNIIIQHHNDSEHLPPKFVKLQIFAFWFIYSLHEQNILSPDIIIHILPLLNNKLFISNFFLSQQSIKKKFQNFIKYNKFPFFRNVKHYTPSSIYTLEDLKPHL